MARERTDETVETNYNNTVATKAGMMMMMQK
jgi:hypothetical protein